MPIAALGVGIGAYVATHSFREDDPFDPEQRAHGVGLLSAGTAAGLVGLTAIGVGAWRTGCAGLPRTGHHLFMGTWLIGTGLAQAAMGAGSLVAFEAEADRGSLSTRYGAIAHVVTGTLMTATGVTLASYELAVEPTGSTYAPTNPAMFYAGMGMATASMTSAGLLTMVLANAGERSPRSLALLVFSVPLLATGGIMGGGIALWIKGGRTQSPSTLSIRPSLGGLRLEGPLP
jgi:hypothetical protein